MGITDTTSRITHLGNGTDTDFTFNFKVFSTDQLYVVVRTDSSGVESVKTLTTDYTVTLNAGEGGTVTMNTAPATGETLYIGKNVAETQPDSITVGNLPAATLEQMYDRLTMLVHQLKERTRRVPLLARSTPSVDKTMAEPQDTYLLGWNASGNIVNYLPSVLSANTAVLDEDDMASDSATAVPTQQSVKAYVDAENTPTVSAITADPNPASLTVDTYLCDTSGGAFTVTLPTALGNSGKTYTFKYTDSGFTNALTIERNGATSETIDGSANTTLNTQGETLTIISDGSNWQILDRRIPSISTAYTPTFQGFGANPSNIAFLWSRIGDKVYITGRFTCDTTTAVTAYVSLPTGLTVNSSVASETAVGHGGYSGTSGQDLLMLATGDNGYVTFASHDASAGGLSSQNGSAIASGTLDISFFATVPVNDWKG